jgi:Zn-dependent M28 family amino/carboxypeptidase
MIAPRRGRWLQKLAAAGKPLRVKVDIESEYPPAQEQAYVEGWIKGTETHDQQIVLTAHIQEEMTSANDDGSGCANLLEIGRALTRLIQDGKLPRPAPRHPLLVGERALQPAPALSREPGRAARMLVNINQDMVGARQSLGGRVQYASRLPWSIPTPWRT